MKARAGPSECGSLCGCAGNARQAGPVPICPRRAGAHGMVGEAQMCLDSGTAKLAVQGLGVRNAGFWGLFSASPSHLSSACWVPGPPGEAGLGKRTK